MPSLTVTRPLTGVVQPTARASRHPKARLRTEDGVVVELPYAPKGTSLGGFADTWETLNRPGRAPLVQRNGDGVATMTLDVILARPDHQDSVEPLITLLRRVAASGDRVTVVNLSPSERGPWRLADLTITATQRQQGTNNITRATAGLTFLAASDARPRLGPVSGGKKKHHKGITKARHYTIKKGDTLRKLAGRFYGEPNEWKRIAARNKIKHPARLKPGRRIVIPADDKKD